MSNILFLVLLVNWLMRRGYIPFADTQQALDHTLSRLSYIQLAFYPF